MTFTIDSLFALCGLCVVAGIGLGFGGYIGLYGAIAWRKGAEWLGVECADLITSVIKRRKGKSHD